MVMKHMIDLKFFKLIAASTANDITFFPLENFHFKLKQFLLYIFPLLKRKNVND